MRRKISLYIADQQVDLDDQSFILFNYTMTEVENPSVVRNSFSQEIRLKGTPQNNRIFGNSFRLDRMTRYGSTLTGADFDPTRKIPFAIYNETNEVLESGYVKLNRIVRKGGGVEYSITLYGGIGSFFYNLKYMEDGRERTLADMEYKGITGVALRNGFNIMAGANSVQEAWAYLSDPDTFDSTGAISDCWNVINFAPAYNGLPDDFAADKALVKNKNLFVNVVLEKTIDGVEYSVKSDAESRLMSFSNPHTEWEICDLRWYLQRPVMSVKAIFEAVSNPTNNGGYEVVLDPAFFNDDNFPYSKGWMTLPMIATEFRSSRNCLNELLKATISPLDFMMSFAKMHGLVFLYDRGEKRVSILSKKSFFESGSIVDLTKRVNVGYDVEIVPLFIDTKMYQLGDEVIGQFAREYQEDYGVGYGVKKINTGYEFNLNTNILTKDVIFKDACDVMEYNRMFTSGGFTRYGNNAYAQNFLLPAYEKVSIQLWGMVANEQGEEEEQSIDVDMTATAKNYEYDNASYDFADWMPKVQLHDEEEKSVDGSYVLLMFRGTKDTPFYNPYVQKSYWLTNDLADMKTLNGELPCWDLTGTQIELKSLPSFRRNYISDNDATILYSYEWGEPLARAIPQVTPAEKAYVYDRCWKAYLTDLYDDDTKVLKCRVNLRGLPMGQSLLQGFYWYEGAYWVLNKVTNHSLTTWDDTECEFIKVNDKSNYLN